MGNRLLAVVDFHRLTVDINRALPAPRPHAKQALYGFGAPGTDEASNPKNFTAVKGKRDVIDALDVAVNGVPRGQVFHAQHFIARCVGFIRVERRQLAAHHHGDDVIFTHACGFTRADVLPVADHADGVRNGFDLVQLVRNVDTGDAVVLQIADDVEQNRGFLFGERGRGLIKDQQPDLLIKRFRYFDQLLLPEAQIPHAGIR